MKARAIQTRYSNQQKNDLRVKESFNPEWQITIDEEYTIYGLWYAPSSNVYGLSTMYRVMDDYGKLIPIPACFFELTDKVVPSCWVINYKNGNLSLDPREFVDDPYLSEAILDREPDALLTFEKIRERHETKKDI